MNRSVGLFWVVLFAVVQAVGAQRPSDSTGRYHECGVVARLPHDAKAFTQGFVFEGGFFYEGTGLHGRSTVRKVEPTTGRALQSISLASQYFGEGITILGERIFQLTWKSKTGFVYDKATLKPLRRFSYPTQGWGLTHDDRHLIMSDGTPNLYFLDPNTFQRTRYLQVRDQGRPVYGINELEYIEGFVYANIWPTTHIAVICPQTGAVVRWILLGDLGPNAGNAVANGIAYDSKGGRLFVTGKLWPHVYQIKVPWLGGRDSDGSPRKQENGDPGQ